MEGIYIARVEMKSRQEVSRMWFFHFPPSLSLANSSLAKRLARYRYRYRKRTLTQQV